MIKIKSLNKIINYSDFLIEKPSYLKLFTSVQLFEDSDPSELKMIKIWGKEYELEEIKEFFVGNSKTLISCKLKIKKNYIELLKNIENYFYFPDLKSTLEDHNTFFLLTSFKGKAFGYLSFTEEQVQIIPREDEVVFNFLIDNLDLIKKINEISKKFYEKK